jgi:hypothetical protein
MKTNNLVFGIIGLAALVLLGIVLSVIFSNRLPAVRDNELQKTEMQSQADLQTEVELNDANFAINSDSQVFDEIMQDIDQVIGTVDPDADFEDIDSEAEFGIAN